MNEENKLERNEQAADQPDTMPEAGGKPKPAGQKKSGRNKIIVLTAACIVLLVLAVVLFLPGGTAKRQAALKENGLACLRTGNAGSIQKDEDRKQKLYLASDLINGSINPAYAVTAADKAACELIYEPLFHEENDGSLTPVLAQSAKWSEDKTYVTVSLKPNLVFSDNTPVTAQDVCASIGIMSVQKYMIEVDEAYYHIEGVSAYNEQQVSEISGLVAVDDSTLEIHFVDACSTNRKVLTTPVQKGLFADFSGGSMVLTDMEAYSNRGTGSGPYVLNSASTTDIRLTANEFYRGEIKDIKEVNFKYVNFYDLAGAVDNGSLDVISYTAAAEQFERLQAAKQYSVYERPSDLIYAVGFNMNNAFLNNEKVRQAIALAFQKDNALSGEWGQRIAATNVIGDGACLNSELLESKAAKYDKAKAKELLAQDNLAGTFSLRLPVLKSNQFQLHIAECLKKDLEDVGIPVEVIECEDSEYAKTLYIDEKFDIYLYSDEMPYGYDSFIGATLSRDGLNVGCSDSEYVELVEALGNAVTDEEYASALAAVSNAFYEKVPLLPYGRVRSYVSVLADLEGITGRTDYLPLGQIQEITTSR